MSRLHDRAGEHRPLPADGEAVVDGEQEGAVRRARPRRQARLELRHQRIDAERRITHLLIAAAYSVAQIRYQHDGQTATMLCVSPRLLRANTLAERLCIVISHHPDCIVAWSGQALDVFGGVLMSYNLIVQP